MKKFTFFLFALLIAAAASSQDAHIIASSDKEYANKDISFSCPDESVFSQISSEINGGAFCQEGTTKKLVATNYTATGPFTSFRFWGGDLYGCSLDNTEPFDVIIWDDDPSDGGTEIFSGTFDGTTFDTGESAFDSSIYQIDIELGAVINQQSGYIGITRKNSTSCGDGFAWIGYGGIGSGSGHLVYFYDNEWETDNIPFDLFFCLSSEEPAAVPLTNWALYFGAILIGVFFFSRIRKII